MRSSGGYFRPASKVGRLHHQAVDVGAVLARRGEVLGRAEPTAPSSTRRSVRELPQRPALERMDLGPASVAVDASTAKAPSAPGDGLRHDPAAVERCARPGPPSAGTRPRCCARSSTTTKNSDAPSLDHETELDRPVERLGQDPRLPAGRRDHGQLRSGRRPRYFSSSPRQVGDLLAVRAPRQRPPSSAVDVVSCRGCAPALGVDDPDVGVRHPVDVALRRARGRRRSACRRATRPGDSSSKAPVVSGLGLLRLDVEQVAGACARCAGSRRTSCLNW